MEVRMIFSARVIAVSVETAVWERCFAWLPVSVKRNPDGKPGKIWLQRYERRYYKPGDAKDFYVVETRKLGAPQGESYMSKEKLYPPY